MASKLTNEYEVEYLLATILETDRQTERQTDRQTGRQTDRHTDRLFQKLVHCGLTTPQVFSWLVVVSNNCASIHPSSVLDYRTGMKWWDANSH